MLVAKKFFFIIVIFISLFSLKIFSNNFLLAENGDTYDFFRVAYEYKQGNYLVESKRMPLFPFLLSFANPEDFVFWGRVLNNLFYFGVVLLVFKIFNNYLYTLVFALFYPVFDNSFFIMADSLFLFLVLLFIYLNLQNKNLYLVLFVSTLAFYTRFEGILLFGAVLLSQILNRRIKELPITILYSLLAVFPYFAKNYYLYQNILKVGYLEDSSGFILNAKNILKAFGTFLFVSGGFYLFPIIASNYQRIKNLQIKTNFILFAGISLLLIFWGFYIRLYTVPLFFMFLALIYVLEHYKKPKNIFILFSLISFIFYLYQVQILDHLDLGENKFSKSLVILLSFVILYFYYFYEKYSFSKQVILTSIIFLNLSLFSTKFLETREKYFTLVQASEFALQNKLKVGYADESGVSKWYLKDFNQKLNFLNTRETFDKWVASNQIEYFIYTEELGFQDKKIKDKISEIKNYEKLIEFKSNFSGGKTAIFKIR